MTQAANIFPRPTAGQMHNEMLKGLAEGGIVPAGRESPLNRMAVGLAESVATCFSSIEIAHQMAFAESSSGIWLDKIGGSAIPRKNGSKARSDTAQVFYVNSGTFGDLNNGNPIRFEMGSTVMTPDSKIVYYISPMPNSGEMPILLPGDSRATVAIEAITSGSFMNVRAGSLTMHDLSISGLMTTNEEAIQSGEDVEGDDSYRARILSAYEGIWGGNEARILTAARSIPGIADAILIPYTQGTGTGTVVLIGTGGKVPSVIAEEARLAIARATQNTTFTAVDVVTARPVRVNIRYTVSMKEGFTDADVDTKILTMILQAVAEANITTRLLTGDLIESYASFADPRIAAVNVVELTFNGQPSSIFSPALSPEEIYDPGYIERAG